MTSEQPFVKRLKYLRKRAGLSQKKLGILAGIDESNASAMMNQYERGTHVPKYPQIQKLASALCVPTAYFYTDDDELAELLLMIHSLNKKNRKALLADLKDIKQPGKYEQTYQAKPPTIHESK